MTRLYSALAITASISYAEKVNLSAFMSLASEEVDHFDLGHAEPEVDDFNFEHHAQHEEEMNENELDWEVMEKVSGNLHCKEGYTKVGCCKCVRDDHKIAKKPTMPEIKAMPLTYHGMEPQAAPTATTASPANLAGWFTRSDDDSKDKKDKKEEDDKQRKQKDDEKKRKDDQEEKDSKRKQDDDDQEDDE